MDGERRLTDCLRVVRHGRERSSLAKGKEEERASVGRKRSAVKRESNTEHEGAPTPKPATLEELIQFDLDWRFGPCTGITRLQRWQRAQDLGLAPPENIKDILLAASADPQYQYNLWCTYAI
ncbi:DNA polymerase delta subunit 4 [Pseudophryne corroboree]|uniref:DNA polymerase delta subunit 4 n=1 Tax=Pseudophryne corroboree TaxID=495146 RepID=UPI0030814A26